MLTVQSLPEIPLPDSTGYPAHVKAAAVFLGAGLKPWRVWWQGRRSPQVRACAHAMRRLRKQGVTPGMCAELLGWDTR